MVVAAVALFLDVFLSFSHEVISATNCIDGTLHLRGQNVVNSALVFSKDAAWVLLASNLLSQPMRLHPA